VRQRFQVLPGGSLRGATAQAVVATPAGDPAPAGDVALLEAPAPTTALDAEAREPIGFAIEAVMETTETAVATISIAQSKYQQARMMGYTGDDCSECGSMKMVRNGTCTKCLDCGSTSGCS
jgi:ribonucleoside-diphosphate reductase alpha chain